MGQKPGTLFSVTRRIGAGWKDEDRRRFQHGHKMWPYLFPALLPLTPRPGLKGRTWGGSTELHALYYGPVYGHEPEQSTLLLLLLGK